MRKDKYILNSEELKVLYKRYGYEVTISPALSPSTTATTHTSYNNNNNNTTHTNKNNNR